MSCHRSCCCPCPRPSPCTCYPAGAAPAINLPAPCALAPTAPWRRHADPRGDAVDRLAHHFARVLARLVPGRSSPRCPRPQEGHRPRPPRGHRRGAGLGEGAARFGAGRQCGAVRGWGRGRRSARDGERARVLPLFYILVLWIQRLWFIRGSSNSWNTSGRIVCWPKNCWMGWIVLFFSKYSLNWIRHNFETINKFK